MPRDVDARVAALLGPTNTGKTHYAIERMLGHRSGVIGLPLRLLAREVYDRIVALRGPSVVALVTGEERIVPARAAYWVCTVEAMPLDILPDFLAVDEIQLCGDPDRGHIFTDRLINARGLSETLFLGSDTMRGPIQHLIPEARFQRRERFSQLAYTGPRKLSRMPPRSAIVGFSVGDVYAIAELIRRQKGGAAVVMGALSPRTRNAQVALFQNGDVDHLVATDAIGMGLNLDIGHVAFSGVAKFDGRRHRHLAPNELAQIAGRAGRYTEDGTFGVTGEAAPLDPEVVEAIESHRFAPLRKLQWRNSRLEFGSAGALIASLEAPSGHGDLVRAREADDVITLKALVDRPEVVRALRAPADVRLLWEVCQVPDFRKVSLSEHANLSARLYGFMHDGGGIPTDWLARQVARIDRTEGDIDALSQRLAYIRTWTYVAQRKGWLDDAEHWREETRAVEDRLSDALHARLTQRFVDRRTSVLMRGLKQRESLVAHVTEQGEVTIEGEFVGRLDGFRFRLDPNAAGEEVKTLRSAGIAALAPVLSLRADRFYNAPDTEIDVTEQGGLMWGEYAVGKLVTGADALAPRAVSFVDEDAAPEIGEKVARRLQHWIDRQISARFEPLLTLRGDEALSGMARGIAFRLVEALGVLPRVEIADEVKGLDQESRGSLRKHGVRFGQFSVFMPALLKPAPTRLRLVLWSLAAGFDEFPEAPPPGLVTVPAAPGAPKGYYSRAGYRLAGDRAIRIDMLERLADLLRAQDARAGFEAAPEMLSITGLTLEQFVRLMGGLGYEAEQGTRPKARPAAEPLGAAAGEPAPGAESGDAATAGDAAAEGAAPDAAEGGEPNASAAESAGLNDPARAAASPSDPAAASAGPNDPAEETVSPTDPTEASAGATDPTVASAGPDDQAEGAAPPEMPPGLTPESDQAPEAAAAPADAAAVPAESPAAKAGPAPDGASEPDAAPAAAPAADASPAVADATEEIEVFYVFRRVARPRGRGAPRRDSDERPQGQPARAGKGRGKPQAERPKPQGERGPKPPKPKPQREDRRERKEKPVDPDNPFAALMALKLRQ